MGKALSGELSCTWTGLVVKAVTLPTVSVGIPLLNVFVHQQLAESEA